MATFVEIRTSFWFVPVLAAVIGLAAASCAIGIDHLVDIRPVLPGIVGDVSAANARSILSAFTGSLVSAVTLIFSLTMVALTMAVSQFGPRVITDFLRSQQSQRSSGIMVGALVYCVAVLWVLPSETGTVPLIAVIGACGAALVAIANLLSFIQFISHELRVSTLVQRFADALESSFQDSRATEARSPAPDAPRPSGPHGTIRSRRSGYVRIINRDALVRLSAAHDVQVIVEHPPGSFVMEGAPLLRVYPALTLEAHSSHDLLSTIAIGESRTVDDDPMLRANQLQDVALRALSPGINDPNTAVSCLDQLGLVIRTLATSQRSEGWSDRQGNPRIWVPTVSLEAFVETALAPIYAAARDQMIVARHIQAVILRLAPHLTRPEHRALLRTHARRALEETERGLTETGALEEVRRVHRAALAALEPAGGDAG